jgi:hypothetical protein
MGLTVRCWITICYLRGSARRDGLSPKLLFEADSRGYWQATDEEKALLQDRYMDLEGMIEENIEP